VLIAFEGLHSAGKSTQVAGLVQWLREHNIPVAPSAWNSSPPLGERITALKVENWLTPVAMVLMEAADLAYRYENGLGEALADGAVVVCDRYFYSTVARGVSRGVRREFIEGCFDFAPTPDLVFYLRCTAQTTLRRRTAGRMSLGGHLSGEDFRPVPDRRQGFLDHQGETAELYEQILPTGTVRIDCLDAKPDIHQRVTAAVAAALQTTTPRGGAPCG
jgi:dTMP kinase